MLLRVPGLGARAVDKIIPARRHTRLRLDDVARLTSAPEAGAAVPHRRRLPPGGRLTDRLDLRAGSPTRRSS